MRHLARLIRPPQRYNATVRAASSFLQFSSRFNPGFSVESKIEVPVQGLNEENAGIRKPQYTFELSVKGKNFLNYISTSGLNVRYSRGGKSGEGYVGVEEVVAKSGHLYYDEKKAEEVLQNAEEIQRRMRAKASESFMEHATKVKGKKPNPILKIVMPDVAEIKDLSGEADSSNQNAYSPLPGLIHKYEMLLALVSINCSAHCRYCYRLDLFNGSSNKSKADMPVIAAYIKTYNEMIDEAIKNHGERDGKTGLWFHKETKEPLIQVREILFSGGDPMTLPNATIARYMTLMAEAGISSIRIGTKELSFNPQRFDPAFWKVMDMFHENYPDVRLEIVGHYSHPYELVEPNLDKDGNYLYDLHLRYPTRSDIKTPLSEIGKRRDWISHSNQFPIIAGLNDFPEVLRLLMYQCNRLGITLHNIYVCREIVGNKHFRHDSGRDDDIPRQCQLVDETKLGLSGLENHGRLVMSTEYGKVEVIGMEGNNVLLKLNRFVHDHKPDKAIIRVDTSKLPEGQKFYWLTDEVIKVAVDKEGQKILKEIVGEKDSLAQQFRKRAAEHVVGANSSAKPTANDNQEEMCDKCEVEKSTSPRSKNSVTIRVETGRNGGFRTIEINLNDKKFMGRRTTLATVLAEEGEVEAACKEQLSCSTCVGEVQSDIPLPKVSEDEKDLVDAATSGTNQAPNDSIRATCQIPLQSGENYTFRGLLGLKTKVSGNVGQTKT